MAGHEPCSRKVTLKNPEMFLCRSALSIPCILFLPLDRKDLNHPPQQFCIHFNLGAGDYFKHRTVGLSQPLRVFFYSHLNNEPFRFSVSGQDRRVSQAPNGRDRTEQRSSIPVGRHAWPDFI